LMVLSGHLQTINNAPSHHRMGNQTALTEG